MIIRVHRQCRRGPFGDDADVSGACPRGKQQCYDRAHMRPSRSASEFSKLWRALQLAGVELFAADFFRFEFDRHSHSQLAVGLIERGAEGLHYRGKKTVVPAGSMIIIEPGEIHTGFAACESGYQYRMFYFDTALVTSVAREMTSHGTINFRHSIVYVIRHALNFSCNCIRALMIPVRRA